MGYVIVAGPIAVGKTYYCHEVLNGKAVIPGFEDISFVASRNVHPLLGGSVKPPKGDWLLHCCINNEWPYGRTHEAALEFGVVYGCIVLVSKVQDLDRKLQKRQGRRARIYDHGVKRLIDGYCSWFKLMEEVHMEYKILYVWGDVPVEQYIEVYKRECFSILRYSEGNGA